MSNVLVDESSLISIAGAIRQKNGTNNVYKPREMAAAIRSLPGTGVLQNLSVTENGNYAPAAGVDGFDFVSVAVPNSALTSADEGKVVVSGALMPQTARSAAITANGTYDTTTNNSVVVAVNVQNSGVLLSGTMIDTHDSSQLDGKSILPVGYCFRANESATVTFDGPDISTEQNSGQNYKCVHVGHESAALIIFLQKIPSSATRLYISVFAKTYPGATQSSGAACAINFFDSGVFGGMSTPYDATHRITRMMLCYLGMTAEQINNQSGVEILVNSNDECPYQTVEVDISSISVDTFLGIYVSATDVYVREISYS